MRIADCGLRNEQGRGRVGELGFFGGVALAEVEADGAEAAEAFGTSGAGEGGEEVGEFDAAVVGPEGGAFDELEDGGLFGAAEGMRGRLRGGVDLDAERVGGFGVGVDDDGVGDEIAEALEALIAEGGEEAEKVEGRHEVDEAQEVADQGLGEADGAAVDAGDFDAHEALAGGGAVAGHFEEDVVEPVEEEHEQEEDALPDIFHAEDTKHAHDDGGGDVAGDGDAGVDGPGEGADGGAGNAKLDFDSVRQFDGLKSVSESVWGCHAQAS